MAAKLQHTSNERPSGFTPFDRHFSRFVAELCTRTDPQIELAAAMLSRVVRQGDTCLDLESTAGRPIGTGTDQNPAPALEKWIGSLRSSGVVGDPGETRPLILDAGNRLYLYRYWQYEHQLAVQIATRVARPVTDLEPTAFRRLLAAYFPAAGGGELDWQKAAVVIALSKYFSVITGGPGTGKTHTIARLLALYCELKRRGAPRIHLAAPTGKAAAQLKTSIAAAKASLKLASDIAACIPDQVFTLHRLLGARPGSYRFHHNAENPLPTDMVVVDEASMVDLALMSKLVAALPPDARLVLAGDRDQLASVEAGSVLGDICDRSRKPGYSPETADKFELLSGLRLPSELISAAASAPMADAIAVLHRNYRFDPGSRLGALSRAVREGEADTALALMKAGGEEGLQWVDYLQRADIRERLAVELLSGFRGYLQSKSVRSALAALERFQILCALKRGAYGADGINLLAEAVLARNRLIDPVESVHGRNYRGRPVIITRNDYELQLFNGDLGLVWNEEGGDTDALSTFFAAEEGGLRKIWPHRLPAHDTVYAMTVHKSQGSEFDHVMLVLPPQDYELLTRELVYTALTRARRQLTVWAPREILHRALTRRLQRSSGLRDALWEQH